MSQTKKEEAQGDVAMNDIPAQPPAEETQEEAQPEQVQVESQSVRILPGSTDKAASFEFLNEGHTLGNALRYIIMKNPDVEMCAYTIPHPSEAKMNVRIQTYEKPAVDALQKGLHDIQDLCNVIAEEFWEKGNQYADAHGLPRNQ